MMFVISWRIWRLVLYISGRVCIFGFLHVFLSPGINILDDPEMELPPLKMSTALPRSFHQIVSLLQIPSTGFVCTEKGIASE